jgi:hypothetical protein
MKMMKKIGMLAFVAALLVSPVMGSFTVATFANPSVGSFDPLFFVDWTANTVNGGWADGKGGLTLEFPFAGPAVSDVWFSMSAVNITFEPVPQEYGYTGGGVISFYEAGSVINPLLVISFNSGVVTKFGFASDDATFSGSKITGSLTEEQFSFAFAAKKAAAGGFSATAAFDASAIPEPATMAIFGIGAMLMLRLRKKT